MLPYAYRITKFDPADRDEQGRYIGSESPISDHGPVETAYLQAVAAFAEETGVRELAIREPEVALGFVNFGLEPPIEGHGLAGLFPADLTGYHDGAVVPVQIALELVRVMLRDNGAWCRLEAEDQLTVHIGYDQYLYVASIVPCEGAVARAQEFGLFPERINASPYNFRFDETQVRPADDEFWARVRWCVTAGQAALLEEHPVHHLKRWHQLTPGTLDAVRARLGPRAMLYVWPDLRWDDVETVLRALPEDRGMELVCKDASGRVWSSYAYKEWGPDGLAVLTAGAEMAATLEMTWEDCEPLMGAVLPDSDGIMRARWGTEVLAACPSPSRDADSGVSTKAAERFRGSAL